MVSHISSDCRNHTKVRSSVDYGPDSGQALPTKEIISS